MTLLGFSKRGHECFLWKTGPRPAYRADFKDSVYKAINDRFHRANLTY